jgi:hypothetical protein
LPTVFGEEDATTGEKILAALYTLDESPWDDLIGVKPLNARGFARRLGQYGVTLKASVFERR